MERMMLAREFAKDPRCLGSLIETENIGDWEGGTCVVINIGPYTGAGDIVFQVRRLSDSEEIGVFGYEDIEFIFYGKP